MLIYLATPYSHRFVFMRKRRAVQAARLACRIIQQGYRVFSPIAHTHAIAECGKLPYAFDYWEEFDTKILTVCDELWIGMLDGWLDSKGIASEIKIMRGMQKKIARVHPETLQLEYCL